MNLNGFPRSPAHQQVFPDSIVRIRVSGSLDKDFEASPATFSQASGVHQAVHPHNRFQEFLYQKVRHGLDKPGERPPSTAADVQRVEVGDVSGREPAADEECVLDSFPSLGSHQQRDDAHGAVGTSVQHQAAPIQFDLTGFDKHGLTLSQQAFADTVQDWCRAPRKLLLIVSGGPGTGKTYCVRKILRQVKAKQLRMSYTAVSAEAIQGRTIHSAVNLDWSPKSLCASLEAQLKDETDFQKCIEQSSEIVGAFSCSGNPRVVVVDEVSMIKGWLMYWLVRFFMDRTDDPLLFVAMGDKHQLNPVRCIHNLFSLASWGDIQVCKITLKESRRFTPQYELIINRLRRHVDDGDEKGFLECLREHFPISESISGTMLRRADRAMAYRNDRVKKFNAYYIKNMVEGDETELNHGELVVKPGCLVFVTKNGSSLAKNGTLLQFKKHDAAKKCVECNYPESPARLVLVNECEPGKFPLDLGFASTVHKFQGSTINTAKIVIHFDGHIDLNLVYTALSRVKDIKQILAISGLPDQQE